MSEFPILICDRNPDVIDAARMVGFETWAGDIRQTKGSLVSPANSFGFMDGGIDWAYSQMFPGIQKKVQERIRRWHGGELPVGQAIAVELDNERWPFLIVAPTMRTPAMNVRGTLAPFLAMRAAIRAYDQFDYLFKLRFPLVVPGLGTASGGADPMNALMQMRAATQEIPEFSSWREAKNWEASLLGERNVW